MMTLDQHHCCMPHILSQATMLELKVCQLSVAGDTGGFGMTAVVRSQQLHLYRNRKEGATLMLSRNHRIRKCLLRIKLMIWVEQDGSWLMGEGVSI